MTSPGWTVNIWWRQGKLWSPASVFMTLKALDCSSNPNKKPRWLNLFRVCGGSGSNSSTVRHFLIAGLQRTRYLIYVYIYIYIYTHIKDISLHIYTYITISIYYTDDPFVTYINNLRKWDSVQDKWAKRCIVLKDHVRRFASKIWRYINMHGQIWTHPLKTLALVLKIFGGFWHRDWNSNYNLNKINLLNKCL